MANYQLSNQVKRLLVNNIRNINNAEIDDLAAVNIFYGANGSGKTTILEAVHILGLGRSFRSSQMRPVIQYQQSQCTVFAQLEGQNGQHLPIGVTRKRNGEYVIKMAGQTISAVSQLAESLPVQLINSETFKLLEGGPKIRRQFLDWGVFHVEHQFNGLWRRLQRCLKQRNSLLRRGKISGEELGVWDNELVSLASQIDPLREQYFSQYTGAFNELSARLIPQVDEVEINYVPGWDREKGLPCSLQENFDRDSKQGFTSVGPHRATINVSVKGVPADQGLSRGQQKMVVCALKLSQGLLLERLVSKKCIYLVDDLPAELDKENLYKICEELAVLSGQVFVTCVELSSLIEYWQNKDGVKVFHVEHGNITAENLMVGD